MYKLCNNYVYIVTYPRVACAISCFDSVCLSRKPQGQGRTQDATEINPGHSPAVAGLFQEFPNWFHHGNFNKNIYKSPRTLPQRLAIYITLNPNICMPIDIIELYLHLDPEPRKLQTQSDLCTVYRLAHRQYFCLVLCKF